MTLLIVCLLQNHGIMCLQVWEERDREFVASGDLTMEEDCLILLIDADTKVTNEPAESASHYLKGPPVSWHDGLQLWPPHMRHPGRT